MHSLPSGIEPESRPAQHHGRVHDKAYVASHHDRFRRPRPGGGRAREQHPPRRVRRTATTRTRRTRKPASGGCPRHKPHRPVSADRIPAALQPVAATEYQVCFKCHADSTNKPATSTYGRTAIRYPGGPMPAGYPIQPPRPADQYNLRLKFLSTIGHNVTGSSTVTTAKRQPAAIHAECGWHQQHQPAPQHLDAAVLHGLPQQRSGALLQRRRSQWPARFRVSSFAPTQSFSGCNRRGRGRRRGHKRRRAL